jgi:hypothetical protein
MKTLHTHISFVIGGLETLLTLVYCISFVIGGLETLLTLVYWSTLWYDETLILRQRG